MKTMRILAGCALVSLSLLAMPAFAATDFRVNVNLGNAPPPPMVVVQHPPRTVWLPDQRVSVVRDPDFDGDYFQVGGYWYVYNDNYWYRARSWRGPFVVIDARYVPVSIARVPDRHWRHNRPWRGYGYGQNVNNRGRYVERSRDRDGRWRDQYGRWHEGRNPNDIWDEDGDGVPNSRDQYDRDPRRWRGRVGLSRA